MFKAIVEILGALLAYAPMSEGERNRQLRLRAFLLMLALGLVLVLGAALL